MGLLSNGSPLDWDEARQYADHVRQNGIQQLINTFNRVRNRQYDCLRWGDEIEYVLVEMDDVGKTCRVSLRAEQVLDALKAEMKAREGITLPPCAPTRPNTQMLVSPTVAATFTATWHPEYGRYMLESTPASPYKHDLQDLLCVEKNMILRRRQAESLLHPNERLMAIGNFPRLGCPDAFVANSVQASRLNNEASHSLFFPDEFISTHARFKTLTRNIVKRRGGKVFINLPIFKDQATPPMLEPLKGSTALFPDALAETPNYRGDMIHLDAMGLGMGCCCLQITFQTKELADARRLYDQLAILCPIMMALTASTPIYRGILSDIDCRWEIISAVVDDRNVAERATIPKSRYSSISRFISLDPRLKAEYNDLELVYNECCYEALIKEGFDELLARHFAWLFVRDPLVIYRELLDQDNTTTADHFENLQSTNWQTMRFKPPPPEHPSVGWRVEFRPMEVQFTDFENAACAVFVVLLTRVILSYDLNFYMPISLVDTNMKIAERRDAAIKEKFYWRTENAVFEKSVGKENEGLFSELTLEEIFNGSPAHRYLGLLPTMNKYLDSLHMDYDTRRQLDEYLLFIKKRSKGELMTPARWIRNFVRDHPDYKRDSLVPPRTTYDLINEMDHIAHSSLSHSKVSECCSYALVHK